MAVVTVVTAAKTQEIEAATIVGATINDERHLVLTKQGGGIIDAGSVTDILNHNGTDYVTAENSNIYIGTVDPGEVADGSIWFDTTA